MKKQIVVVVCLTLGMLFSTNLSAQKRPAQLQQKLDEKKAEETGSAFLKFEPNYTKKQAAMLAEFNRKKAQIDSMDISKAKRRRLLKALYKNKKMGITSGAKLTETTFEEKE